MWVSWASPFKVPFDAGATLALPVVYSLAQLLGFPAKLRVWMEFFKRLL
jgi:hypothetical protein